MALNEETTLLFENYLENQLSEADKNAFENRLTTDEELAAEFAIYKEVSNHFEHQFSEERDQFKQSLEAASGNFFTTESDTEIDTPQELPKDKPQELPKKTPAKVVKFKPWQYAMAASMMLLAGIFMFQNGNPDLNDYKYSEQISLTERSSENATIKAAERNFNNGSYAEAIANFETLLEQDPENTELQFYKALAHDALQEYDESEDLFAILASGNSAYKNKALFYWGIGSWKQDKISNARETLSKISESAAEYKKAQKLIKKL